jgi:hypothetical protein
MVKKTKKTKKEITVDDLAIMVQKGFVDMKKYVDGGFVDMKKYVDKGFSSVKGKLKGIKDELKGDIKNLEAEVKYRRVHIFDHKDLEFRVEKLEEKVGTMIKKK